MTPEELDYLAVAQEELRAIFAAAQARAATWEPAPYAPSPPSGPAAATSGGGDGA